MAKQKKVQMFVCTHLLNQLSYKILVAQALKIYEFATKPDQRGLSSLTRLEVMHVQTQIFFLR